MEPTYTKSNAETGVEARVFAYGERYTVTLCDLDSGQTLPHMRRVATLAEAVALADKWAA
jgi:hypothetical protein